MILLGRLALCGLYFGVFCGLSLPAFGETWYIRADGGDRSQCTGKENAPYPGSGSNRPCALKHFFYLFTVDPPLSRGAERPEWIISGGDTVVFQNGVEHRIGYKTNDGQGYWNFVGCRGTPASCHNPTLPAGTAEQPTRLVGESAAEGCPVKAKVFGGYGVNTVLNLNGAVHAEVDCLEISDFAQCGTGAIKDDQCVRSTPPTGFPKSDYALRGISTDLATDRLLLRNLDIHGLAQMGIRGRIGGFITADHIRIAGIQGGGWDNDDGGGVHSTGSLILRNSLIEWCGCLEEYPIRNPLPYYKCFDQTHGGYGDGLGILAGNGMRVDIHKSTFRYNVQDGVDLLYVQGGNASAKVTRSSSYGNGGQQWKFGPFKQIDFFNNLTVGNCRRAAETFEGIPETWNQNYTDYCRALDGVAISMKHDTTVNWIHNTMVGYTSTIFDLLASNVIDMFDAEGRVGPEGRAGVTATDGQRREFQLSFPLEETAAPGIRVNNSTQSIGRAGVDTGRVWYWEPGSNILRQDPSAKPLAATDRLVIQYRRTGYADTATFNYLNNIFRGYPRLDSRRTPSVFYYNAINEENFLRQATRRNNLYCGATAMKTLESETYLATCPGNWLAAEPAQLVKETDLDALNLHLGANSPAKDKAAAITFLEDPDLKDDHDGIQRPYGEASDIGAFEAAPVDHAPAAQANSGEGKVYLQWDAVPAAVQYRVQRRPANGEYGADLGVSITTSVVDSNVEAGQQYCYRVRAESDTNSSEWSEEVCLQVLGDPLPAALLTRFPLHPGPHTPFSSVGGRAASAGGFIAQFAWAGILLAGITGAVLLRRKLRRATLAASRAHVSLPV